jgi:hypothetical protein
MNRLRREGQIALRTLDSVHEREEHFLTPGPELPHVPRREEADDLDVERRGPKPHEADDDLVLPDAGVLAQNSLEVAEDSAHLRRSRIALEVQDRRVANAIAVRERLDLHVGEAAVRQ